MGIFDRAKKALIQIPGRLTSIALEKVVCGADEVYDDTLNERLSDLNSQFKAIADQLLILINGGEASVAVGSNDIIIGSGAIVTANAVARYCLDFVKENNELVRLTLNITFSDTVSEGNEKIIIYLNNSNEELTVTVPNAVYKTPNGEVLNISIPVGGYGEISILNLLGTIFARGC